MDSRFGWHINPELELSVGGQNLLQPHFAQFGADPGGPVEVKRSVYAKLVWRFGRSDARDDLLAPKSQQEKARLN